MFHICVPCMIQKTKTIEKTKEKPDQREYTLKIKTKIYKKAERYGREPTTWHNNFIVIKKYIHTIQ